MPKKIFSVKKISGSPSDSVDNILKSIFERTPVSDIALYAQGVFEERGAMKKMGDSRWAEFFGGSYNAMLGTGTVEDIPFVLLRPRKMKYIINFQTILLKAGDGPWKPKTPWFLRHFLFSRADMVISPSKFTAGTVKRYFPDKHVIDILNGVDLTMFSPDKKNVGMLLEKYAIRTGKPIVVFIGTLQPRKRPDLFVEVARRFPDAHFVAVGRQYPEYDLLSSAKDLSNFQWIPLMPRGDIAVLLASSYAFIFPSVNEPAAAVILESMASGTVPILSKSGGNGEFLKDGESGILIDHNEHELDNFVAVLRDLVSDPARREKFASAARREAERHGFDVVADAYRKTILSLWNSH